MNRKLGSPQIHKAHASLVNADEKQCVFTFGDLVAGSGWAASTAQDILRKKLSQLLLPVGGGYKALGMRALTTDSFCCTCSQSAALSRDSLKPTLTSRGKCYVIKAREAALAAVQNYNNPTAVFRSGLSPSASASVSIGSLSAAHAAAMLTWKCCVMLPSVLHKTRSKSCVPPQL